VDPIAHRDLELWLGLELMWLVDWSVVQRRGWPKLQGDVAWIWEGRWLEMQSDEVRTSEMYCTYSNVSCTAALKAYRFQK
jgi:hypothetical protein